MNLISFEENEFVLVTYPEMTKSKLHAVLKGPYRVVKKLLNSVCIQNLVSMKIEEVHVKRLRKYVPAEYTVPGDLHDPVKVAMRDTEEWIIEGIESHHGYPARKSEMEFKCKFEGLSEKYDLWFPWSELRNNPILHKYLRDNKMEKIIPKEHNDMKDK